ncbi:hypothetical protein OHU26_02925 [Streptomyces sp. NBC_00069]|nr:hypothetical protein OG299_06795 [Streptomyces sp. NBC_01296]WSW64231.1 hypothetical protein OG513_34825 [Streptomyces sp. NBC_00998]
MKRLGRGAIELLKVAEELRDAEIDLDFLTGPLQGKRDPAGHDAALFASFAAGPAFAGSARGGPGACCDVDVPRPPHRV